MISFDWNLTTSGTLAVKGKSSTWSVNSENSAVPVSPAIEGFPSSSIRFPATFKIPLARPAAPTSAACGTNAANNGPRSAPVSVVSIVAGSLSFPKSTRAVTTCGWPNSPVVNCTFSRLFSVRPTSVNAPASFPLIVTLRP